MANDDVDSAEFARRRARENAGLSDTIMPWQEAIKLGDRAYRIYIEQGKAPLTIYYEVLRPAEGRHLFQVKAYSQARVQGEFATLHKAVIGGILSDEDFEIARGNNWPDRHDAESEPAPEPEPEPADDEV